MLRKDDDSVLRVALDLEASVKRKRGRPKKTRGSKWREETEKIGLKKEDVPHRAIEQSRDRMQAIAEGMG